MADKGKRPLSDDDIPVPKRFASASASASAGGHANSTPISSGHINPSSSASISGPSGFAVSSPVRTGGQVVDFITLSSKDEDGSQFDEGSDPEPEPEYPLEWGWEGQPALDKIRLCLSVCPNTLAKFTDLRYGKVRDVALAKVDTTKWSPELVVDVFLADQGLWFNATTHPANEKDTVLVPFHDSHPAEWFHYKSFEWWGATFFFTRVWTIVPHDEGDLVGTDVIPRG